jgi:hypothetical protein
MLSAGAAVILLLASAAGNDVSDEVHQIPAGDWKFVPVPLHQHPARISASYEVLDGSSRVRMLWMLREDLQWMDSDPGAILSTPEGRRGYFTDPVRRLGDYVVVLDNREGRSYARVRLHIGVDGSAGATSGVGTLSPPRQLVVIAVSCVGFLGIVAFSARRLRKAMSRE